MSKNILIITSYFHANGGIERVINTLSKEFLKKGYEVHLLCKDQVNTQIPTPKGLIIHEAHAAPKWLYKMFYRKFALHEIFRIASSIFFSCYIKN